MPQKGAIYPLFKVKSLYLGRFYLISGDFYLYLVKITLVKGKFPYRKGNSPFT